MRLLLVSNGFPPIAEGGAEAIASGEAKALAGLGWDVHVLTLIRHPGTGEAAILRDAHPEITIHCFRTPNLYHPSAASSWPGWTKPFWHVADGFNMGGYVLARAVIDRVRPDLVHTHNVFGFSPAVWLAAANKGVPVVHTVHDYWLLCPRTTLVRSNGRVCQSPPFPCRIYRLVRILAARALSLALFPLEEVRRLHQEHGWPPGVPTAVLPNFVSLPDIRVDSGAESPGRDGLQVVFLGKLDRHKGLPTLLEAFRRFLSEGGTGVLHVAGEGPLRSLLAEYRSYPIIYHGYVRASEKGQLLANADVLAAVSEWFEISPLTVWEAIAAGKPVLVSDVMLISSLVREIGAGWVVPGRDPMALAAAFHQVAKAKACGDLERAAPRLRQFARNLTPDAHVSRLLEIYQSVLQPTGVKKS